jgi:hypothetical protein
MRSPILSQIRVPDSLIWTDSEHRTSINIQNPEKLWIAGGGRRGRREKDYSFHHVSRAALLSLT